MKDKSHPERISYLEWYGSVIGPKDVDLDQINKDHANLYHSILEIEDSLDYSSCLIPNDPAIPITINALVNQTQKGLADH